MLTVTFSAARKLDPRPDRWAHARKALGPIRTVGETTPIPLERVLDACGLNDALWVLDAVEPAGERDKIARLFASDCAEWCLHYFEAERPGDNRPRRAIEAARAYALDPTPAGAAARAAAGAAANRWMAARLRQYLTHGAAAMYLPCGEFTPSVRAGDVANA